MVTLQKIDDNFHIMREHADGNAVAAVFDVAAFDRVIGAMVTPDEGQLQRKEEHEIATGLERRLSGESEPSCRLDNHSQVQLYAGLVDDLGLKPGDMVLFVRNDAGRWEVRAEGEVTAQIQGAGENGKDCPHSWDEWMYERRCMICSIVQHRSREWT